MDLSKLSANQQLAVGAAAVLFISMFFPWFGTRGVYNYLGWRSGLIALVGMALIVGAGVILLMEGMDRAPVASPAEVTFYLAAAGLVLIAFRFVRGWEAGRRFGVVIALIAAAAAAWATYANYRDNT